MHQLMFGKTSNLTLQKMSNLTSQKISLKFSNDRKMICRGMPRQHNLGVQVTSFQGPCHNLGQNDVG